MERWYGRRPLVFENRDLDLAVAVGAAYYSYVRSTGAGLLVRGGLPRAYYIGIGGTARRFGRSACCRAEPKKATRSRSIAKSCSLSRTSRYRSACTARSCAPKTSSATVVEFDRNDPDLHLHAPLEAVIRFGKKQKSAPFR